MRLRRLGVTALAFSATVLLLTSSGPVLARFDGTWVLSDSATNRVAFGTAGTVPDVTLTLTNGAALGQLPCNAYTGRLDDSRSGPALTLTSSTVVACADSKLEVRYLELIERGARVERGIGAIELVSEGHRLQFDAL